MHMHATDDSLMVLNLPAYWAPRLVDGDGSGYDEGELAVIDGWLANECLGACLGCSDEPSFSWDNDTGIPLGCDCLAFTFASSVHH
jgi:hypothetical protein